MQNQTNKNNVKKRFNKPTLSLGKDVKKPLIRKENDDDKNIRKEQQKYFNKRKNKDLKQAKHQEKVSNDKREKIMKKLNNTKKQEILKDKAKENGLFCVTEIDKELMQAFRYYKINFKKYFNSFASKHLTPIKVKGLYLYRYKKEEYLNKKKEFISYLQIKLKNRFLKIQHRFNYTMERYCKKYNDNRFQEYMI